MLGRAGYLLEIEGCAIAIASSANAPVQFGQTVRVYKCKAPVSAPIRVDYPSGSSETGGGSFWAANVNETLFSDLIQGRRTSPITRLTADLDIGDVTADVEDTSAFDAAGYIYVGTECIAYAAKNATQFTGLTRAQYGSEEQDHAQALGVDGAMFPQVFGFLPSCSHRRCWVWRYDFLIPSDVTQMFGGFVSEVRTHPDGSLEFVLASTQVIFQGAQACAAPYAKGKVVFSNGLSPTEQGYIEVNLDNPDVPFPDHPFNQKYAYLRYTGEDGRQEIIGYRHGEVPYFQTDANGVCSGAILDVTSTSGFQVGDTIDILTTPRQRRQIRQIVSATRFLLTDNLLPDTAGGEDVQCMNRQRLHQPIKYGGADLPSVYSSWVPWVPDGQLEEVRYLSGRMPQGSGTVSGTDIDILLQILLSRKGDQTNTNWDVLPPGYGLGINSDLVDVAAFYALLEQGRGGARHYLLDGPLNLDDLIRWVMWANSCYIYVKRDGKLTAKAITSLYPGNVEDATVNTTNYDRKSLITTEMQESRVKNSWSWLLARPAINRTKDPTVIINYKDPDSIALYGQRKLADFDDPGADADASLQATISSQIVFMMYGRICPRYRLRVPFESPSTHFTTLRPGMTISLTAPVVPDGQGGTGVTDCICRIVSCVPYDAENAIEMEVEVMWSDDYCLVAPCMKATYVEHVAQSFVAMARAVSLLSQSGDQDSDHFQINDPVRIWDTSTLGTGAEVSATTEIADIDYATRVVTLLSMPLWMDAGDLIVPNTWANWAGRTTSAQTPPVTNWQETFGCLADETNTPPDLAGDAAYKYGA